MAKCLPVNLKGFLVAPLAQPAPAKRSRASAFHEHFDEPVRLAEAFKSLADNSRPLEVPGRYEYRLRRQFERALSDYLRIRELPRETETDESGEITLDLAA